jgi:integrase/recombinase XerD
MLEHEAERWLSIQRDLGRAPNTLLAYRRSLESYGSFCLTLQRPVYGASKEDVALFVRFMTAFRLPASRKTKSERSGMANATIRLRLTAVRLFYDHLIEEGLRGDNPVGRGRYTQGGGFGGARSRALVPHFTALPWIPTDAEWRQLLHTARSEPLRNRVMLAMAYDAGLRREELCLLATGDIDPAHRLLTVRAETTKSRRGRVVPYSEAAGSLLSAYLAHRRTLTRARGPLFISESRRNAGEPLTFWTWSKVVHSLAERAGLPQLSTHTFRHLCLTDLARAGWELHEIASFAGHRNTSTTLIYIHLSGRELTAKIAKASLHTARMAEAAEVLQ